VDRLNAAFVKSLEAPEVKAFLEQNGAVGRAGPPEELAATLKSDWEIAARQLKATGIRADE
jgi:tripartite-type tricarboxylate transporter receptor subunit TctC